MTANFGHEHPSVVVRAEGAIAEITVGTGAKRNALTADGWTTLERTLSELGTSSHVRVIVIRGRDQMFCAGSDMTEWIEAEPATVEDSFARMEAAFQAAEECPKPVVAEIHGIAAGAGCQLALACDLRFMASSARIGMPIARLGILTSPAFAARLSTLAGPATARRLLYTGELLDGPSAVAAGLAEQHWPDTELNEHTAATLVRIAAQPPETLRAAKHAVTTALEPTRTATRHNQHPMTEPSQFHAAISTFLN